MTPPSGQRARARSRPPSGRISRARRRGQALVELALILPILLFLLLGALDLGRVFYANITVASAAKEAALRASGGAADGDLAAVNESRGGFVTIAAGDVTISPSPNPCDDSTTFGTTVTATVTTPFQSITPYVGAILGGQTINLTSVATAHCVVLPTTAIAVPTPTSVPTPTATPVCKTVPNMVGSTVSSARSAWSAAGFTGSFSPNGQNNKTVLTQDQTAGACLPATTSVSVTHT